MPLLLSTCHFLSKLKKLPRSYTEISQILKSHNSVNLRAIPWLKNKLNGLNFPLDKKLQYIYNVFMKAINFSWDDRKNLVNQKKHRVSFEEAQSVFFDEHAIEYYDPDHSESEDRFLMLGLSYQVRVLVVTTR